MLATAFFAIDTVLLRRYYVRIGAAHRRLRVFGPYRVNQKRRTRKAVIDAARAILDRGERPTVALAAEEAMCRAPPPTDTSPPRSHYCWS